MRKVHKLNPEQVKEQLRKAFALTRRRAKERKANLPSFTENLIPHGTATDPEALAAWLEQVGSDVEVNPDTLEELERKGPNWWSGGK